MEHSKPRPLVDACRRAVDTDLFDGVVFTLVVGNAIALALELMLPGEQMLRAAGAFFTLSTLAFVVELAVRIMAHGPAYASFFRDRWNVFDFVVTALSLLPMIGTVSQLGRMARLLRVLRFLRVARLVSVWRRVAARGDGP